MSMSRQVHNEDHDKEDCLKRISCEEYRDTNIFSYFVLTTGNMRQSITGPRVVQSTKNRNSEVWFYSDFLKKGSDFR